MIRRLGGGQRLATSALHAIFTPRRSSPQARSWLRRVRRGARPCSARNCTMATARVQHTATLLPSGKVLVAGGHHARSHVRSAELYDPATGTWTTTGRLNTKRGAHTATLLPSGEVLVAGGGSNDAITLNSAELYDPATGTWALTASLRRARQSQTATLLLSGEGAGGGRP
jgi:Galactose oxidase, central domain/Kelch motif